MGQSRSDLQCYAELSTLATRLSPVYANSDTAGENRHRWTGIKLEGATPHVVWCISKQCSILDSATSKFPETAVTHNPSDRRSVSCGAEQRVPHQTDFENVAGILPIASRRERFNQSLQRSDAD